MDTDISELLIDVYFTCKEKYFNNFKKNSN